MTTAQPSSINHMLELFKMQFLMKYMDSSTSSSSSSPSSHTSNGKQSLFTLFILLGYDQLIKYVPYILQLIASWFHVVWNVKEKEVHAQDPLLLQSSQPPTTKSVKAFIQFERATDGKFADPCIDAVLHHVCNLPEVRSLRYNGIEMIPNFKDSLLIENDIWFELVTQQTQPSTSTSAQSGGPKQEAIVYRLSTYDHDIIWLHRFVGQAMETFEQEKQNKLGSEQYYFDMIGSNSLQYKYITSQGTICFTKSKFISNRSLQNVYLKQIDDLQTRVEFFLKRRDWYDAKGIPHTLGIVMYGVPGCGKTSTIKAIANETKRHIFNLLLSEIKTKDALKELFYNDQVNVFVDGKLQVLNIPLKHRLYVIEDIDAMDSVVVKRSNEQIKKEEEYKLRLEAEMELLKQTQGEMMARNMMKGKDDINSDKLDLSTVLNVLDGVRETPGRIIVLSTNYPERLDEALLRPGRFDMMLEFEKHSCVVLKQHLEKHYDTCLTSAQESIVMNSSLEKKWTPAEVSQILFRRIADLDGALQDLFEEDPAKLFKFSQLYTDKHNQTETNCQSTNLDDLLKPSLTDYEPLQPQETIQHIEPDKDDNRDNRDNHKKDDEPDLCASKYLKDSALSKDPAVVFKDCVFDTQSILFGIHADMGLLSANDDGLPVLKQIQESSHQYPEIELASHTTILQGQLDGVETYKLPQEMLGSIPAEFFGIAAANEGSEPFLDDYFPDI